MREKREAAREVKRLERALRTARRERMVKVPRVRRRI